jgi:hypothetical protein
MEPDDLLCSRNARSRTPLVGRAQSRVSLATPLNTVEKGRRTERHPRWSCAPRTEEGMGKPGRPPARGTPRRDGERQAIPSARKLVQRLQLRDRSAGS